MFLYLQGLNACKSSTNSKWLEEWAEEWAQKTRQGVRSKKNKKGNKLRQYTPSVRCCCRCERCWAYGGFEVEGVFVHVAVPVRRPVSDVRVCVPSIALFRVPHFRRAHCPLPPPHTQYLLLLVAYCTYHPNWTIRST